jgi:hypothetical protein
MNYALADNAVAHEEAANRMFCYAVADMLTCDAPKAVAEMRRAMLASAVASIAAAGLAAPRKESAKRGKGKPAKPALDKAIDRALSAAQHVVREYAHVIAPKLRGHNARDAESLAPHVRAILASIKGAATVEATERAREAARGAARRERAKEDKAAGITPESVAADKALASMRDAMGDASILAHMAAPDMLAIAADMLDKAGAPHLALAVRAEMEGRAPA